MFRYSEFKTEDAGESHRVLRESETAIKWCRGGELNSLRRPFQGHALPVSYPGTGAVKDFTGAPQGCQCSRRWRLDARGWSLEVGRWRFEARFFKFEEKPPASSIKPPSSKTYLIDASNSRIHSFPFRTSRGFVPSAGPTMPSFSIISISRAARPYPTRRRRCRVDVDARPASHTTRTASWYRVSSTSSAPGSPSGPDAFSSFGASSSRSLYTAFPCDRQ